MDREENLLRHNAAQVAKYLEFRDPITQKNTAGSFFSNEADRKSESRVPMSERGHVVASNDDNRHFERHVGPILINIREQDIFKTARFLEHDPTALRRWRRQETDNEKEQLKRFTRLCKFVAVQVKRRYPGLRIFYQIHPEDEEANTPREANDRKRTWDKCHSYRLIGAEIERVIAIEGCGIDAAKGLVSQRDNKRLGTPCSLPRVHAAWLFYQRERKEAS